VIAISPQAKPQNLETQEEAEEVRKGSALTDMRAIILITKSNLSSGAKAL